MIEMVVINGFVCQWQPIVWLSSCHDASQPKSANDLSGLYKINVQNKMYSNDFHENDKVGVRDFVR